MAEEDDTKAEGARQTFNLTAKSRNNLRTVQEATGSRNETEALQRGLSIAAWLVDFMEHGGEFILPPSSEGGNPKNITPVFF